MLGASDRWTLASLLFILGYNGDRQSPRAVLLGVVPWAAASACLTEISVRFLRDTGVDSVNAYPSGPASVLTGIRAMQIVKPCDMHIVNVSL